MFLNEWKRQIGICHCVIYLLLYECLQNGLQITMVDDESRVLRQIELGSFGLTMAGAGTELPLAFCASLALVEAFLG